VNYVLVEQPGVLIALSRRRSWVQIPSGTLMARYANLGKRPRPTFGRCPNLGELSVGSTPKACHWKHASAGHWRAQVAVTHPPSGIAGSTPARRTSNRGRRAMGEEKGRGR